jgi:enterochelin esterase-like enzyme
VVDGIDKLRTAVEQYPPDVVERLWASARSAGGPLIEPGPAGESLVTFLWRGEAEMTAVDWGVQVPLRRVPGTDLWHAAVSLPSRLRTLYYLTHEGADGLPADHSGTGPSHVDPLNQRPFFFPADPKDPTDRDCWASLLELPDAPAEPWVAVSPTPAPGTREPVEVASSTLGESRSITVYRPAGAATAGLGALVVFDGHLAQHTLRMPQLLDALIAAGRIPPLVALFVHGQDARRDKELGGAPEFTEFVAGELLPWARAEFGLSTDPARTGLAGASLGGLTAAHLALAAPDTFGLVLAQSGSFWHPGPDGSHPEWLIKQYATQARADLRLYLDVGELETQPAPGGLANQLDANRRMHATLTSRGYPVTYREYLGGHDYVNWRRLLPDALIDLYGR